MANETLLGREYELEINTGTTETPVWTVVRGWTANDVSPETERTDDTHAHSGGWRQGKVAQRGLSLSYDFYELRDASGQRDPGQQALLDLGEAFGTSSLGEFRRYHKSSGDGHTFFADVEVAWPSGGPNENAAFSATLNVDGEPEVVTVTPAP